MATYYVDDGGDGTTEDAWATADTSINALDTEYAFASGDIVYFGHDHVCQAVNAANLTITLPTSGKPTLFISATQGSSPPSYAASSTAQIDTSEGAYNLFFDGSLAMYGMSVRAGADIIFLADANENLLLKDVRCRPAANGRVNLNNGGGNRSHIENLIVDLTDDGTTNRSASPIRVETSACHIEILGLSFVNAAYRTGTVFQSIGSQRYTISGADFSDFTNATLCELFDGDAGNDIVVFLADCLTAATWAPLSNKPSGRLASIYEAYNCGPAAAPTYLYTADYFGELVSSSSIYRTGGQTIDGTATAWLITTTANAAEGAPWKSKWIYGVVSATGSKTFDVFCTNDTADFTDAEVWLEVEYYATASEAISAVVSDTRTITTTAAAQTDDVTSTWNGTGPSFTYKQKLSVTATVNVAGRFRARVCVGLASIASSRYFYIDPLVTVS